MSAPLSIDVPERNSSLGATQRPLKRHRSNLSYASSERLNDAIPNLENDITELEGLENTHKDLLKHDQKFTEKFWTRFGEAKTALHKRLGLQTKRDWELARRDGMTLNDFEKTEAVITRRQEMSDAESAANIAAEQALRAAEPNVGLPAAAKRTFWHYFLHSHGFIDKNEPLPPTRSRRARELRDRASKKYQVADPENEQRWHCPITNTMQLQGGMTGAHIVPCKYGPDIMATIFGSDCVDDMNKPENGFIMLKVAEDTFDNYLWTLEPDVEDPSNAAQVEAWLNNEVREFKILVLNDTDQRMTTNVGDLDDPSKHVTIASRHGERVAFRSKFRPRSRYIYLHWALANLKKNPIPVKDPATIRKHAGAYFFGSQRSYLQKSVLTGLADYMGHEYAELFPVEGDERVPSGDGMEAAATVSMLKRRSRNDVDVDEDDDTDSEDEDFETIARCDAKIEKYTKIRKETQERINSRTWSPKEE